MGSTDQVVADGSPEQSTTQSLDYVFPAIRGVQAGHEYFVTMLPLRLLPRVFLFDELELLPEDRAQRAVNKARIPEIARYMLENPTSYVFPALVASVDAVPTFVPLGSAGPGSRTGTVRLPTSARFVLNDGQHRRAGIQRALRENPDLGNESIPVVLFQDLGLARSQQMFADLNRHGIRPTPSLGVLYDHRDISAITTKLAIFRSDLLRDLTEKQSGGPSTRARKLFTLSAFHTATKALLAGYDEQPLEQRAERASIYWNAVSDYFPEWRDVRNGFASVTEIRKTFIHSHSIVLSALGRVGNSLLRKHADNPSLEKDLRRLTQIDWRRSNVSTWEGRAMVAGRVSMTRSNVLLTTAAIRSALDLPLPPEEQQLEEAFIRGVK